MSTPLWTYYFCFFRHPASAVRPHTLFPLILRKSIRAIFTKCRVQDYWVSVLLGIAFTCSSSFVYGVIPKYSYFQYLLVSLHLRENDEDILLKLGIQDCYVYSSLVIAFGTDSSVSKRVIAI